MLAALKILHRLEKKTEIEARVQHISGEHNHIADMLSRGKTEEAMQIAREHFSEVHIMQTSPEESELVSREISAARRH